MANKLHVELPVFKIGCSSIGKIMTPPKGKLRSEKIEAAVASLEKAKNDLAQLSDKAVKARDKLTLQIQKIQTEIKDLQESPDDFGLGETARSHCDKWLADHLYGLRGKPSFSSKYIDKGNEVEQESLDFFSVAIGNPKGYFQKVDESKENEYMKGIADCLYAYTVLEFKNSYDHYTFPLLEKENPNPHYEWQVQGYMALYKKPKAKLVYALMNMPDDLIVREAYIHLGRDYSQEQFESFAAQYNYDHLPLYMRLKVYEFERDDAKVQAIYEQVEKCRQYIAAQVENLNTDVNFEKLNFI